jgi:hypothetical protein
MKNKVQSNWFPKEGSRERPENLWKSEVIGCGFSNPCSDCEKMLVALPSKKVDKERGL